MCRVAAAGRTVTSATAGSPEQLSAHAPASRPATDQPRRVGHPHLPSARPASRSHGEDQHHLDAPRAPAHRRHRAGRRGVTLQAQQRRGPPGRLGHAAAVLPRPAPARPGDRRPTRDPVPRERLSGRVPVAGLRDCRCGDDGRFCRAADVRNCCQGRRPTERWTRMTRACPDQRAGRLRCQRCSLTRRLQGRGCRRRFPATLSRSQPLVRSTSVSSVSTAARCSRRARPAALRSTR